MPTIAIVILNYNGKNLLEKYLPTVAAHHQNNDIYIIDNNSSDDSIVFCQQYYSQIKIVQNIANYGFAKGYNEGLKHINADYYVIMNNDIRTTEGWLNNIVDFMEQHKNVAVCMPKLLSDTQPDYFEYAGASGGFLDVLGYPFCRGRIFLSLEKDAGQYNDDKEIFWATGACMVIKSSVFWEAEGLDDDFFAHMEEIDLCWRIKNLGYSIYAIGSSSVYHLGGGTLNKINPKKTYLNFRNSLWTLLKNHPRKNLWKKIFLRLILDGVAGTKFLLEGNGKHTIAVIKAHFYFYGTLKKFLLKRQLFESKKNFSHSFLPIYTKSIVFQHYLKGKNKFTEIQDDIGKK